jgi:Asp-tRNA(Asn)/Glu-tRNA(Gln) amidotransferase A subunit family amidase
MSDRNDEYVPEMHFVDEGDESGGDGAEPDGSFTAYQPDIEIIDPSELEEADRRDFDEIKEALKATQEELKSLKGGYTNQPASDPNQANAIAQAIKEAVSQNQQQPEKARRTPQQLAEEINSEFYDKGPYETMMKFQRETMGPVLDQATGQILSLQKRILELDPNRSKTYKKYREEIDREVQRMTPEQRFYDSEAYIKAHDRVMGGHQEEVMEDRLQEMLRKELEKMGVTPGGTAGGQKPKPQQRTSFSETVQNPGSAKAVGNKKKVALTPQEKQFAYARGMTMEQYADWKSRHNM